MSSSLTKDLPANPISAESDELCTERTVEAGQKIRASEITVSVYNAGRRAGAASTVMRELQSRGFVAGESKNAPDGTDVRRAQVWADTRGNSAAKLVAAQFGDDIAVKINRKNIGIGIVVVVGNELGKLVEGTHVDHRHPAHEGLQPAGQVSLGLSPRRTAAPGRAPGSAGPSPATGPAGRPARPAAAAPR